jgi:hypothetical protein
MTGDPSKQAPPRPVKPSSPPPRPATPKPPTRMADMVRDARLSLAVALARMQRPVDPASYPHDPDPLPSKAEILLFGARADVGSALRQLSKLESLIHVPGPPLTVYASDEGGGPFDHQPPGEAGRPAPVAASSGAAGESEGAATPAQATARPAGPPPRRPGAIHLAGSSFSLPVWPGTDRLVRLINESVARGRRP